MDKISARYKQLNDLGLKLNGAIMCYDLTVNGVYLCVAPLDIQTYDDTKWNSMIEKFKKSIPNICPKNGIITAEITFKISTKVKLKDNETSINISKARALIMDQIIDKGDMLFIDIKDENISIL